MVAPKYIAKHLDVLKLMIKCGAQVNACDYGASWAFFLDPELRQRGICRFTEKAGFLPWTGGAPLGSENTIGVFFAPVRE